MKFGNQYLSSTVPEWSSQYLDYHKLKKQIKVTKESALELAKSYATIKNLTSDEVKSEIDVSDIRDEKDFLQMVEAEVNKVEKFYEDQLRSFTNHFNNLVAQMISLGLIEEYVPRSHKGHESRLERELSRMAYGVEISYKKGGEMTSDEMTDQEEEVDAVEVDELVMKKKRTAALKTISKRKLNGKDEAVIVIGDDPVNHDLFKNNKRKVKKSFIELYRGLMLLQGFSDLNMQGLKKILKKHDKNLGVRTKGKYFRGLTQPLQFPQCTKTKILVTETEYLFADGFTGGHRTEAMDRLRVPLQTYRNIEGANFRLGLNLGVIFPILVFIIYFLSVQQDYPRFASVMIVYRMLGMAALMTWFWGLDIFLWTKFRINYVFIFEFNPRQHIRHQHLWQAASLFTVVAATNMFFYFLSSFKPQGFEWLSLIPWQMWPLSLVALSLFLFALTQARSQYWLVRTIGRIVAAPFKPVLFRDFYLADQLASFVIVLYDLEYTLCFFMYDAWSGTDYCTDANVVTRPIIALLPLTWRVLQCVRRYWDSKDVWQLANAGKYVTGIMVALLSVLRSQVKHPATFTLWLLAIVVSTCYTFTWDLKRDWGLGDMKHKFLRSQTLYPLPMYYFAIGTNLIMRLMWTLTISPESIGIVLDDRIFTTILGAVEIMRRAQWNLFRLENEQLNNVGKFRAVNILIPLPTNPLPTD